MSAESIFAEVARRVLALIARCARGEIAAEAEFNDLALEVFRLQFASVPVLRGVAQARGVTPEWIKRWPEIPALPTRAFQDFDVTSLPMDARSRVFFSSGTSQAARRSRHYHSPESLGIYEAALVPWFERHVTAPANDAAASWGGRPFNLTVGQLVALTPPPAAAPHSSLVHMIETVRKACGFERAAFSGVIASDGVWDLDAKAAVAALREAVAGTQPVVVAGPAFAFVHLLDALSERGQRLQLPAGSRAMETGGYKGRTRVLSRVELYQGIEERLGLPKANIVSEYGMSELSSQAYDHAAGTPPETARVFRFPPWVRARIVSPETGLEVGEGEIGLLRVWDLANVYSAAGVQTEDLAVRRGTGFELVGRAQEAEARGCSLMFA